MDLTYEICVEGTDGALAAERAGAHRVELCAALSEDGLTPSLGMLETTLAAVSSIRVHAIVRPRGGDFVFEPLEVKAMERDVRAIRSAGAHGVVVGALTSAGEVDRATLERLMDAADGLDVTFHRAFDTAADPWVALDALMDLGVDRVLTSGQESSALEGAPMIAELVRHAGDRLTVMPGGGITPRNVRRILAATGAREIHFSARAEHPRPAGRVVTSEAAIAATIVSAAADDNQPE